MGSGGDREMSQVLSADGKRTKTVKNLGWLLRNWQSVERLEWETLTDAWKRDWGVHPITDGIFRAYMRDGRTYATLYASFDVWKGFVDRPVFRGLPVIVNGIEGRV